MDNQRNFILAAVLSLAVVFLWQMFVISPRIEAERAAAEAEAQLQAQTAKPAEQSGTPSTPSAGDAGVPAPSSGQSVVPGATPESSQPSAAARVEFKSDKLDGSINLKGARIDDLNLALYRQTVDPNSPEIRLLMPVSNENAYFAEFGFSPNAEAGDLPGPSTIWSLVQGDTLTPQSPVVLEYVNDKGLKFQRQIELDNDYMFTDRKSVV